MKYLLMVSLVLLGACGGSGGGGSNNQLPPVGHFVTVDIAARTEIEPNDSLATADAHTMPSHGVGADYVGFGVTGSVDDVADRADYFLFTASRTHAFTIRLCPSLTSCIPFDASDVIDTSVAYFEVLDQTGTLVLSSEGNTPEGNALEVHIDAGVVYYLAVFAEDTVGAPQSFYIEMVEVMSLF